MPAPGSSTFGPYEIIGPLGSGGMGEVYRARDPRLQRNVALKILRETNAHDPLSNTRLLHEARAASALNHPNILVVYDVGTERDVPYVVSELIDGRSLRDVLSRGSPRPKNSSIWQSRSPTGFQRPTRPALCIAISSRRT